MVRYTGYLGKLAFPGACQNDVLIQQVGKYEASASRGKDETSCSPVASIFILVHFDLFDGALDEVVVTAAQLPRFLEGALTTTNHKGVAAGVFLKRKLGIAPLLKDTLAPKTRFQLRQRAPWLVHNRLLNVERELIITRIVQVVFSNITCQRPLKVIHPLPHFEPVLIHRQPELHIVHAKLMALVTARRDTDQSPLPFPDILEKGFIGVPEEILEERPVTSRSLDGEADRVLESLLCLVREHLYLLDKLAVNFMLDAL